MTKRMLCIIAIAAQFFGVACAQDNIDSSSHTVQFVTVEPDVKLEVLDWGGSGRPLVFLAGLGDTAHVFDTFAPRFAGSYHVYGITRRGFGVSSKPAPANGNYAADRLADDVLAVLDRLKLDRPVLVGHSLAGEELSSVGSRFPERVAGLIYLDAANAYAYYDSAHGDLILDTLDLQKRIAALEAGAIENHRFMGELLTSVSQLERDLQESVKQTAALPDLPTPPGPPPPILMAIIMGTQKYTVIRSPILAIFACPHNFDPVGGKDSRAKAAMVANDLADCSAQADALQRGIPSASVVRLRNADHSVFASKRGGRYPRDERFPHKSPIRMVESTCLSFGMCIRATPAFPRWRGSPLPLVMEK